MSVNSKMTAIADAIRAKTGGTGLLTLDDMAQDIAAIDTSENLDEALDEQESLIDQIQAALEGKSAAAPQTANVSFVNSSTNYNMECVDSNGIWRKYNSVGTHTVTVVVPSYIRINTNGQNFSLSGECAEAKNDGEGYGSGGVIVYGDAVITMKTSTPEPE